MAREDHLAQLITDVKESLGRELREGFRQLNEKLDRQDARLARQGTLLQTGGRQIARVAEWSETADDPAMKRDSRIAELERRVAAIEKRLELK